jgi:hypothetical protein
MSTQDVQNALELTKFIIDRYTFERLVDLAEIHKYPFDTYSSFYDHNIKCISDLTDTNKEWLLTLCNKMKDRMINLVDEESCVEFEAHAFYFNAKKELCITNPR